MTFIGTRECPATTPSCLIPMCFCRSSTRSMPRSCCPLRTISSQDSSTILSSWRSFWSQWESKWWLYRLDQWPNSLRCFLWQLRSTFTQSVSAHAASSGVRVFLFTMFSIGYVIKLMPLRWFDNITIKEDPLTDEQEASSLVAKLRKSHRQSLRQSARSVKEYNARESARVSGRASRGVNFPRESGRAVAVGGQKRMSLNPTNHWTEGPSDRGLT